MGDENKWEWYLKVDEGLDREGLSPELSFLSARGNFTWTKFNSRKWETKCLGGAEPLGGVECVRVSECGWDSTVHWTVSMGASQSIGTPYLGIITSHPTTRFSFKSNTVGKWFKTGYQETMLPRKARALLWVGR